MRELVDWMPSAGDWKSAVIFVSDAMRQVVLDEHDRAAYAAVAAEDAMLAAEFDATGTNKIDETKARGQCSAAEYAAREAIPGLRVVIYEPDDAGDTLKALAEGFDFCEFFKAAGVDTSTAIDCPNILAVAPIPDNGRAFGGWGA